MTLGRPAAGDTLAISVAMLDPEVSDWLHTFPFPYSGDIDRKDRISSAVPTDYAVLVDGRFAGIVLAAPELGCWIDPKFRGSGIATRAAALALSRHFMTGAQVAHARHLSDDQSMKMVLERLGFRPDPSIKHSASERGIALMRLTLADFARAQPFQIKTPSTEIIGLSASDLPALYDIAVMRDVGSNLTFFRPGMSLAEFGEALPQFAGLPPFWCAIRMQDRVIGGIGLDHHGIEGSDTDTNMLRAHCFLAPAASGLGIGSEVLAAFVRELVDRFDLHRLAAKAFVYNRAATGILAAAGFKAEGQPFSMASPSRSGMAQCYVWTAD